MSLNFRFWATFCANASLEDSLGCKVLYKTFQCALCCKQVYYHGELQERFGKKTQDAHCESRGDAPDQKSELFPCFNFLTPYLRHTCEQWHPDKPAFAVKPS